MRYPAVLAEPLTLARARDGSSLARFGDGELKLALGRDAKSQRCHPELQRALRRVLHDWTGPCVPCIPNIAKKDSPKEAFWSAYRSKRYLALYRAEGFYGSSFVTRPDSAPWIDRPEYWELVRSLWAEKDVVLVRGSTKSLTAADLRGAASVTEVIGPRQHAWSEVDTLFAMLRNERRPIILCLGATATVLAWRLAHEGRHALDLGHVGMFMRKRDRGERLEVTEEDKS
jgi:hypothetical protein